MRVFSTCELFDLQDPKIITNNWVKCQQQKNIYVEEKLYSFESNKNFNKSSRFIPRPRQEENHQGSIEYKRFVLWETKNNREFNFILGFTYLECTGIFHKAMELFRLQCIGQDLQEDILQEKLLVRLKQTRKEEPTQSKWKNTSSYIYWKKEGTKSVDQLNWNKSGKEKTDKL